MLRKILLAAGLILVCSQVSAAPRQVPLLFAYQATLIDEGGNLLPNGYADVNFKILDSLGTVLYEENQNTYIDKGIATVMIGNGINPLNGSPTGGIPTSALDPTDTKFLLVEVPGYKPYDKVEIVAAPYALWADTAMKMPDGAITNAMLGKGIITKDNLDSELKSAIFSGGIPKDMLPSDTLYGSEMQGSSGASKVGVDTAFIYSSSQTVQGVLKDLDLALNKRRQEIDWVQADYTSKLITSGGVITSETKAREDADKVLQTNITNEGTVRLGADGTLQGQITNHNNLTSAHGANGAVVGAANSQTLSNKTYEGTLNNTMGNHNGTWQNYAPNSLPYLRIKPTPVKTGWVQISTDSGCQYAYLSDSEGLNTTWTLHNNDSYTLSYTVSSREIIYGTLSIPNNSYYIVRRSTFVPANGGGGNFQNWLSYEITDVLTKIFPVLTNRLESDYFNLPM